MDHVTYILFTTGIRMDEYHPWNADTYGGNGSNVCYYREISNIRRTKSQNLNDSPLVLHLSLPNILKPCVK